MYLLLAGLLIAISIANGVLTILKVSRGSLGSLPKFSVKVSGWFGCGTSHICSSICVHHNMCSSQGGLGVGLSHMILTLLSVYFWIVVFSHRLVKCFLFIDFNCFCFVQATDDEVNVVSV